MQAENVRNINFRAKFLLKMSTAYKLKSSNTNQNIVS